MVAKNVYTLTFMATFYFRATKFCKKVAVINQQNDLQKI